MTWRLIEEALRPRLEQTLEAVLCDAVPGYRPGRSALSASQALRAHLSLRRTHVATTDIEAFFPSIRREALMPAASPSSFTQTELVAASVGLGEADSSAPAHRRLQTLYVTANHCYLAVNNASVVVRRREQVLAKVPLHRLDRIVIIAHVGMSSGFASACIGRHIPVTFVVGKGRAFGSLSAGGLPNPLRLRAQYDLVARREARVELARAIVAAKIDAMVRRLKNVTSAAAIRAELVRCRSSLAEYTSPEGLRGAEGQTTKLYYEGFAARVTQEDFAFTGRTRRPPRDAINSLLSFAYTLVFSEMQSALLAHGLDPHPALLHDLHRNHPALASDLVEPYRVLVADTFVLTLVNQRRVAATGFEIHPTGAVLMDDPTRHTVLEAFEAFMVAPLGGARGSVSPRRLIDAAASAMLRVVLGEDQVLTLPLGATELENLDRHSHAGSAEP